MILGLTCQQWKERATKLQETSSSYMQEEFLLAFFVFLKLSNSDEQFFEC